MAKSFQGVSHKTTGALELREREGTGMKHQEAVHVRSKKNGEMVSQTPSEEQDSRKRELMVADT